MSASLPMCAEGPSLSAFGIPSAVASFLIPYYFQNQKVLLNLSTIHLPWRTFLPGSFPRLICQARGELISPVAEPDTSEIGEVPKILSLKKDRTSTPVLFP